jgi:hypothetical protein
MKTTPWFGWRDKPVREGWYDYEGDCLPAGTRMYWNCIDWGFWAPIGWVCMLEDENDRWRGLVESAGK